MQRTAKRTAHRRRTVPESDITAEYPFEITLRRHGDVAKGRVGSPSHPMAISTVNGLLTVALARRGALDRDFVLVVDQLAHEAAGLQAMDETQPDLIAMLASICPRIEADGPAQVSAKILVDCSGSMAGDSIEAAKRALQAAVVQLASEDKFSLSRFGSTVAHRSRGLWSVTQALQTFDTPPRHPNPLPALPLVCAAGLTGRRQLPCLPAKLIVANHLTESPRYRRQRGPTSFRVDDCHTKAPNQSLPDGRAT